MLIFSKFLSLLCAVPWYLTYDPNVPPHYTTWKYSPTWWGRLRNNIGYALLYPVAKPIKDLIDDYRKEWKLPLHSRPNDAYSQLAQISQVPATFEYPRLELPPWFHFTGTLYLA